MLPFIGTAVELIGGVFNRRHERAQAKHEATVEQIKAGSLERAQGWKDELALVVIVAPFIACFIPGAAEHIRAGFETLRTATPEWYQWLFTGGVSAALGLQSYTKIKK